MDYIKHDLLRRYSEERLTLLLFYFKNMDPVEAVYFLGILMKILDEDGSVAVFAHFLSAQSRNFPCPKYAQRALNYHIHALNRKMSQRLPGIFRRFVPMAKPLSFAEAGRAKGTADGPRIRSDPFLFLVDSIFEVFIKTSNAEVENSIKAYFVRGQVREVFLILFLVRWSCCAGLKMRKK